MFTAFSLWSGPGASNRVLPTANATPPAMPSRISSVKIAFPTMTRGLRARLERRRGTVTCSGSSAARGDKKPKQAGEPAPQTTDEQANRQQILFANLMRGVHW